MPKTALKRSTLASFETLVRKVKETFLLGRKRVKQEMVRTYWQTGKYIHEHILVHRDRADYGSRVVPRLSKRTGMSDSSLWEILQFYRKFPKVSQILHARGELLWGHLRKLAMIPDTKMRKEFIKRAAEGKWTTRELESKIKAELNPDSEPDGASSDGRAPDYSEIARPKLGTLYTYRLIRTAAGEGALKIDQGFRVYRTEFDMRTKLKAGDIVESRTVSHLSSPPATKIGGSASGGNVSIGDPLKKNWIPPYGGMTKNSSRRYAAVPSDRGREDLFTYKAFVERVVDGDTLLVEIDLGFANTTRQYLRLRALDAPEIQTAKGRRAKEFVASLLKPAPFIFLTTTRSDKYDRYLADVFIPGKDFLKDWFRGNAVLSATKDLLYLNNELLKNKLAVRMNY